jgi:hypothetical protein
MDGLSQLFARLAVDGKRKDISLPTKIVYPPQLKNIQTTAHPERGPWRKVPNTTIYKRWKNFNDTQKQEWMELYKEDTMFLPSDYEKMKKDGFVCIHGVKG